MVLAAWLVGAGAYLTREMPFFAANGRYYFFILSVFTYSAVGNIAPFFEVGSGIYLDNRRRLLWLLPALSFAFVIMVFCCSKAIMDLLIGGAKKDRWVRTLHRGKLHNNLNGMNNRGNRHVNGNGRLLL
jgi:hypothetical protein